MNIGLIKWMQESYVSCIHSFNFLVLAGEDAPHADAVHAGLHQSAGKAGAVTQCIQVLDAGLEFFIHHQPVGVELDLHTIQQGRAAGDPGHDLVQHFQCFVDGQHDAVGQHQAQVAGDGVSQRGPHGVLGQPVGCGAPSAFEIAITLHDHLVAGKHVAHLGDIAPVFDGCLEWLCEILRYQQGKVGVGGFEFFILVGVPVDHCQELAVFFFHHFAARIPAEGAHLVFKGRGVIHQLGFIQHRIDLRGDGCVGFDAQPISTGPGLESILYLWHIPFSHSLPSRPMAATMCLAVILRPSCSSTPVACLVAIWQLFNQEIRDRGIKEHLDTQVFQFLLDAGVNVIRFFGAHVAHAGIDQLQVGLRSGPADGIDRRAVIFPVDARIRAKANVQLVHVSQRLAEFLQADVLRQVAADLAIRVDGELAVAEAAAAGETGGDGAGLAIDAGARSCAWGICAFQWNAPFRSSTPCVWGWTLRISYAVKIPLGPAPTMITS